MSNVILVAKDEHNELPIPTIWRNTLSEIATCLTTSDYTLARGIPSVSVDKATAKAIAGSIAAYGETLVELPEATWNTSVYRWQVGYWEVLVDLYTHHGASDLVLHLRVQEDATAPTGYCFHIDSVFVP